MRILLPAAFFAAAVLSGCASRQSLTDGNSPPESAPVAVGKSNRFQMIQNGRRMSADDFDAWMKARGIRVAKGPQAAKRSVKPRPSLQAQAKPQAKAPPKRR